MLGRHTANAIFVITRALAFDPLQHIDIKADGRRLLIGLSGGDDADHITTQLDEYKHANQHFDPADADPTLFTVPPVVIARYQYHVVA